MRKVIPNTTPLLSLIKIGQLELLKSLYGYIFIPEAVYKEIEAGNKKPFYVDIHRKEWINIVQIKDKQFFHYLKKLDAGEAEVLVLANELKADLVIMDEIQGRKYAAYMDFHLTGTMGILLKAKEFGYIKNVRELLNDLLQKGTWLHPSLIKKVLKLAGEL